MLSFGPAMIKDAGNFFKQIRFVDIAGTIINWMRYLGVWVIIYFMYKILQQNNAIKQEKLLVENLAKTTELELLKMQLNPHFLFNALNSIKALVIINPEQSRDAIVKLSELLRFTLQYGKQRWIPLNEEMQEVKKYLELEELRFGSRLQVTYNIDPGTLSQPIPPAIVLTLAENAVKHGVAKQPEEHTIQFTTLVSGDFLLVQVTNTGYYYNEQSGATGLGLKHIVKRLEEIYHNKAIFTVGNEDGRVMARMQTPLSWQ
jgi:LytS/YehU family sensor histidine kinase